MNAGWVTWILPCLAACALPASSDAADKPDKKVVAFFKAVREGNLAGIQEATKKNVNLNALDENDNTALCIAASAGRAEVVDALLKAGAKVDVRNGGASRP